jgi:hypothetical protein
MLVLASELSKPRGSVDGMDGLDGMDVATGVAAGVATDYPIRKIADPVAVRLQHRLDSDARGAVSLLFLDGCRHR